MQPAFEPRVVHVGFPPIDREGLAAADDCPQLAFRQLGEIDIAFRRISPGQFQVLGPCQRVHVGNIPLLPAADFDAERIDQDEMGEPRGRSHHHLRRDPTTKTGADQHGVLEFQLGGEIQIEIGDIIDRARAVDQWRVAVARMPGRNYPISPRQEFEPWLLRGQPFTRVQKQQWATLTAFHQL